MPAAARRAVGIALVMAIVALYLVAALGVWGLPGMSTIGALIAIGLLVVAVTRPGWWDRLIA